MSTICNITIVSTIYNLNPYIEDYIHSLNSFSFSTDFHLVMIDDGSGENIRNLVYDRLTFPNKTLIRNEKNLGILQSLIIGVNRVKTEYFMVLDTDDK